MVSSGIHESTLDPDDWNEYRATSHRILDDLFNYLQDVRDRPVWRTIPPEIKDCFREEAPKAAQPLGSLWDRVRELILPYPTGNIHPRFFGWVHGTGTPGGVVSEMIAAAINSNLGGREHAPVYVERQVLNWAKDIFGFPKAASGILLSGTSMANVVGLCIGRNSTSPSVKTVGVSAIPGLLVYSTNEAHVSIRKALELIGLGSESLRVVPVGTDFRMNTEALQKMISEDRAAGRRPFCVVGTAGTVNTGAIDDLTTIAEVTKKERLWFHVDGAFGALTALSPLLRSRVRGIERADSLAVDFHKWLHVPYSVGCLLVREEVQHREAFQTQQQYLMCQTRGLAAGAPWFSEYGPELSREFLAFKVWFTIEEHGVDRLAAMIEKNCDQAVYLGNLVMQHPSLELCAPISLNVVCFRYRKPDLSSGDLNCLNEQIIIELQEAGLAAPSAAQIGNNRVIRVALTNHRTLKEDLDVLVRSIVSIGDCLIAVHG